MTTHREVFTLSPPTFQNQDRFIPARVSSPRGAVLFSILQDCGIGLCDETAMGSPLGTDASLSAEDAMLEIIHRYLEFHYFSGNQPAITQRCAKSGTKL